MEIFVARQPIFDAQKHVTAYELLFRDGPANVFPKVDGTYASSRVLHDSIHVFGLDELAAGKPLFINVTREILLRGLVRAMPPERVAVEVLETVEPDDEVVAACRSLKRDGYTIALDDFVLRPGYDRLIELADIIKVDFRATVGEERANLARRRYASGTRLLAEKVETNEEVTEATRLGYSLYQGFFFCKPQMVSARDIPAFKLNYMRLLQVISAPSFEREAVEQVVKQEVSLSVKLLRYLNSAAFGLHGRVTSLGQAIGLLGETGFRRWASVIALAGLGDDRPNELVISSLTRARFAEALGAACSVGGDGGDLFLVGVLSSVDALLGRPMAEALSALAITPAVSQALLTHQGAYAPIYDLILAYERGDWASVAAISGSLGLSDTVVSHAYRDAVTWTNRVFAA